jgi:putative transposase
MNRRDLYLNNVVEQDHRAIKRRARPMLRFKDFDGAHVILGGIEVMRMTKKGQVKNLGEVPLSAAQQFYALVS